MEELNLQNCKSLYKYFIRKFLKNAKMQKQLHTKKNIKIKNKIKNKNKYKKLTKQTKKKPIVTSILTCEIS